MKNLTEAEKNWKNINQTYLSPAQDLHLLLLKFGDIIPLLEFVHNACNL